MYKLNLGIVCCIGLLMTVIHAKPASPCLGRAHDILFVLDSSSSIWVEDFTKQLKFVEDLVDSFKVEKGKSQARVGIITFSDQAHLEFPLGPISEPDQMKKTMSRITHRTGGTNTTKALELVRSQVEDKIETRTGPIVAIVVTDGKSSDHEATKKEAKRLHQLGINVYAIGVGDQHTYDINELKAIASDPVNGVYTVSSYSVLKEIAEKLHAQPCDVTIPVHTTISTAESSTTTTTKSSTIQSPTTTTSEHTTIVSSTIHPPTTATRETFVKNVPSTTTLETTEIPMNMEPENPHKYDDNIIIFGYDITLMGSFRVNMISQFINVILSYTGFDQFGVFSYAYCPVEFNIPVISLKNKKPSEIKNSVAVNITLPGLTEIVRQMRSEMYTRGIRYVHSDQNLANQVAVLFIDPSVTVITPELIEETEKIKQQGVKLFVINVGHIVWPQPQYLHLLSSQPYVNYLYTYPTYEQLLYTARHRPFQFRKMCNRCTPNIHSC